MLQVAPQCAHTCTPTLYHPFVEGKEGTGWVSNSCVIIGMCDTVGCQPTKPPGRPGWKRAPIAANLYPAPNLHRIPPRHVYPNNLVYLTCLPQTRCMPDIYVTQLQCASHVCHTHLSAFAVLPVVALNTPKGVLDGRFHVTWLPYQLRTLKWCVICCVLCAACCMPSAQSPILYQLRCVLCPAVIRL